MNHKQVEVLMSKEFSTLTKEEKKLVQKYNRLRNDASLLDDRIRDHGVQQFTKSLYESIKYFINETKYKIEFDGTFYNVSK